MTPQLCPQARTKTCKMEIMSFPQWYVCAAQVEGATAEVRRDYCMAEAGKHCLGWCCNLSCSLLQAHRGIPSARCQD